MNLQEIIDVAIQPIVEDECRKWGIKNPTASQKEMMLRAMLKTAEETSTPYS